MDGAGGLDGPADGPTPRLESGETEPPAAAPEPGATALPAAFGVAPVPIEPLPVSWSATAVRRGLALLVILAAGLVVVSIRTISLLSRDLDPDLASSDDIAEIGRLGEALGITFVVTLAIVGWLTWRWMTRVRVTLGRLALVGAVDTSGGDVLFASVGVPDDRRTWLDVRVEATRRLPRITVASLAVALVASLVAVVVRLTITDLASGRTAAVLAAPAAAAWVVAAAIVWSLVESIDRRQRAAMRAVQPAGEQVPDALHAWPRVAIAVLATAAAAFALGPAERPYDDRSCPAAETTCRIVTVQRDQLAGGPNGRTVDVTFALRDANEQRSQGTFLFITGGPGSSGILDGGLFLRQAPKRLLDRYDVVLFDPRGVGRSDPRDCPEAAGRYVARPDAVELVESSEAFAVDCVKESSVDPATLPSYGSAHLAEDIEAIRSVLGVDRMVVYGISYGTVIAQRYAQRHPDRIEALLLDGALDPAQGTIDFWVEADKGFETTLSRVLAWCGTDNDCDAALPDPGRAYERLLERLDESPIESRYADPDGVSRMHPLDRASVIRAIGNAMYDQTGRMLVLHALASSGAGDDVPLGRLVGPPPTVSGDPWESDFAYYATLCADFAGPTGGSGAGYMEAGRQAGALRGTLDDVYRSALPCVNWPTGQDGRTPGPWLSDTSFPVVVFTGSADPITPAVLGHRIAARLSDGYLVETLDGPHGTFGRGDGCVDDAVLGLLLDQRRPSTRTIRCDGFLTEPYVDVLPSGYDTLPPIDIARALDDEIITDPAYRSWVYSPQTAFGCRFAGRIRAYDEGDATTFTFDACEVFAGQPIDGSGRFGSDGTTTFELRLPDGEIKYEIDLDGVEHASGEFRGVTFVSSG